MAIEDSIESEESGQGVVSSVTICMCAYFECHGYVVHAVDHPVHQSDYRVKPFGDACSAIVVIGTGPKTAARVI